MKFSLLSLLTFIGVVFSFCAHSQIDSTVIQVSGRIREENNQPISNVIVINQRTKSGSFGKADGSYQVSCFKSDTLIITSLGYYSRKISFIDSLPKEKYTPITYLDFRTETLSTVEIFAPKDLEQIQKEIKDLGYNEDDFMISGISAVVSPITFLYQQFSKREASIREKARLENEDRKRALLKDLFHHYVDYDIIQLSNEQFDDFIDYLNVSDDFLKSSSQYDFLIYVKEKFKDYKIQKRKEIFFKDSDYEFDKE